MGTESSSWIGGSTFSTGVESALVKGSQRRVFGLHYSFVFPFFFLSYSLACSVLHCRMMAVRPLVLPEPFSGDGSWSQWESHFEDVAAVNSWEEAAKLLWLRVRLTGRARTAYQRFSEETKTSYERSMKGLKKRFEPDSKKELYLAELQARCKQRNEGWPEFAEDIRLLADSAYPNLPDDAREQISLTHFLGQITNPRVSTQKN